MNKSVILAILFVFCLPGLAGCGQKGPLYLPQPSVDAGDPPDDAQESPQQEDPDDETE